jgi:hypothetical protein
VYPYRQSPPVETPAAIPRELAYLPEERRDQQKGMSSAVALFGGPSVLGCIVWKTFGTAEGVVGFLLAFAVAAWWWRRKTKVGALLRVEHSELRVYSAGSGELAYRVALADLEDVVLETKTIQRIVEGGNARLGATYLNPRIAPETDTNRIALQHREEAPFPLSKEFLGQPTRWSDSARSASFSASTAGYLRRNARRLRTPSRGPASPALEFKFAPWWIQKPTRANPPPSFG